MIQACEDLGFTLEARQTVGIPGKVLGQQLQSNVTLELRIARSKYDPHASFSER
jgi:hypothetical protein